MIDNILAIEDIIKQGENLKTEFKSDKSQLSDRSLISAVVAMANTEGGMLLLGVEDNGEITGLHSNHDNVYKISALISNNTSPSLAIRVELIEIKGVKIARLIVPKSSSLIATSDGRLLRRRLKLDGLPEAVPFLPHEFIQRQSYFGLIDPSAMIIEQITSQDLISLQRERLRMTIKINHGDVSLYNLSDDELDGSLGLCRKVNNKMHPTVAGLLFLGSEELIQQYIPAYEVAFHVIQGTDVKINNHFHKPIIETFEIVEQLFKSRIEEEEIQVGLYRVAIPNFSSIAFREAFINALVHRDYARLGTVIVKIHDNVLSISNPGGFIDGVNIDNLLSVAPNSRNKLLADIVKRLGLAERTGRGIDRIYEGMLRYGRPIPDYSTSTSFNVTVQMENIPPDIDFLRMLITQDGKLRDMPIDYLIILSRIRELTTLTVSELVPCVQKPMATVQYYLQQLVEQGFIISTKNVRSQLSFSLNPILFQQKKIQSESARPKGLSSTQYEQIILDYIKKNGAIKRSDVMDLCNLSKDQSYKLLKKLNKEGLIIKKGVNKYSIYELYSK